MDLFRSMVMENPAIKRDKMQSFLARRFKQDRRSG